MQTAETSVHKQQKRLWGDKGWGNHYIQAGRDNFHEAYKKLMTILLNEERGMDDSAERKRTRPKMEDNEKERMIRQQRRNGV